MAVTQMGNSYLVSGKEAKRIENYVFKQSKQQRVKEIKKEREIWAKFLQKRKSR